MKQNQQGDHKRYPVIAIIAFLIFAVILSNFVLLPAYSSYSLACKQQLSPAAANANSNVGGYFIYNASTQKAIVVVKETNNTAENAMILRHELCHVEQFKENRKYSCNVAFGLGVFANEAECYIRQYM